MAMATEVAVKVCVVVIVCSGSGGVFVCAGGAMCAW